MPSLITSATNRVTELRALFPSGSLLPEQVWSRRHRVIVVLLFLHVPALVAFGLFQGLGSLHVAVEVSVVALAAVVACSSRLSRQLRACLATFGLVTCSAILVHMSGGFIEAHFHFFVVLGIITLYQNWVPCLFAIGYVVLHHGIVGTIDPSAVYNLPDAWANPWKWALIHGAFVVAASVTYLAAWRLTEHQALHDPLTQLPNRALFRDRLDQAVARTGRTPAGGAVLFVDVDEFKTVNDTLGHAYGDELIVAIGQRLSECVRRSDTVARLGGDEFGIVAEGIASPDDLHVLARRVLEAFDRPFSLSGHSVIVTASVGVASIRVGRAAAESLVRDADAAMYRAKGEGKHRYVLFDPTMRMVAETDPVAV